MQIVFILAGLGAGGAERVVSLIASDWAARGRDVTVIAFDQPDDPIYHAFDPRVRFARLGIPSIRRGRVHALVTFIRRLGALHRILRALKPDVTISFLTKINTLTLLCSIGTGRKVIVSERNNPRLQNASRAWNLMLRALYRTATAIVMQTRASVDCLPAGSRENAHVIHNPIAAWPVVPIRPETRILTAAGRLDAQKGFDLLIEAFAKVASDHPDWTLVIWGEGDKAALEAQVATLGLEHRISLPGLSRAPGDWIRNAAVFVLSSRYEGFGNVLGEAMMAGLPVAAFNCDFGPAEMVHHDRDGLLVANGDVAALSEALGRLMGDAALRDRLGNAARVSAQRFAPDRIIAQWDQLLLSVSGAAIEPPVQRTSFAGAARRT